MNSNDSMIEIRLRDDPVILHGLPEESVGSVLYGTLIITPSKALKAKSVSLHFTGMIELKNLRGIWISSRLCRICFAHTNRFLETWQRVPFLEHQWSFLSPGDSLHTLQADKSYEFPFEYPLKGDDPVSVNVPNGRISYRLTATIERPSLLRNIRKTELVKVQRAHYDFSGDMAGKISCVGRWANSLGYTATIPRGQYFPGDTVPLQFSFFIHDAYFVISEISLSIKEVARFSDLSLRPEFETEKLCEITRPVPKFGAGLAEYSMMIQVPDSAQPDCRTDVIEVSHMLVAKVKLHDSYKRRWWFYISIPFAIRSEAQYELSQSPPSYEHFSCSTHNPANQTEARPPPYEEKTPLIVGPVLAQAF
ncbi:hypothetical protein K493DRAFT_303623 [Basidiobolus meristosporus CBS 931.73]|uniref:Arrestin C-terminal-like domain-containing protein n=1 Tax=Basidiobolus meristosporus CBS 931.73 TaxID=1314790 RepID=A0A1Y1Y246_9FUNG|nr:hypothetical protein K493DRAFT_303623 [Basidiobolus meristosporus CBS 931.73]|eukprot:ORX92039.1 hypothetical protein K493DRAFT_303623 [Basidiobolus meristosporus CBS 931.73]